jgi:hypothetical protein
MKRLSKYYLNSILAIFLVITSVSVTGQNTRFDVPSEIRIGDSAQNLSSWLNKYASPYWVYTNFLQTNDVAGFYQPLAVNLTSIGGLANSSGWLKNNGSGSFSYSTPSYTDVGAAAAAHTHSGEYEPANANIQAHVTSTHVGTTGTNATGTWGISISGSASTLSTGRSIYGNSFNGSADLSQVIASTYGGTGNGFTKISGPATSEKTFTLPNASTTIRTFADIEPMFGTGIDSTLMLTTLKFPMGYSQGVVIDTIICIATTTASGGSVNVTPKLFYGTDISATGTAVITSPSAVTSKSTATKVSSFNNATVAKGNMIWLTFTDVTTKPRNFMVQIIGHKQ